MAQQASSPLLGHKIGFLGAGMMASAMIRGLISNGVPPTSIAACDLSQVDFDLLFKMSNLMLCYHFSQTQFWIEINKIHIRTGVSRFVAAGRPRILSRFSWSSSSFGHHRCGCETYLLLNPFLK